MPRPFSPLGGCFRGEALQKMVRVVGRSIPGGLNLVGWSKAILLNEEEGHQSMAELLQLEFNAPGAQGIYDKVNAALGFDPDSTASYPKGLLSHIVGLGADGASIAVTEVWNSKKDQEAFLADKLGAALAAGGAPAPTRNEWYTLLANNQLR
jgi:hypothetical protein